jgi:predicted patatin/cPLA2 family phospholipase
MRQDPQVLSRLLSRAGGKRKDKYKIGLIVQGGGMRGAFSSGAMMGLDELGMTEAFDYVYGSSSGSCASAYFLSGQIQSAGPIYWDYLYGFRFIRPWNLNRILDLDYLCDDLFRNERRLDLLKLRRNPAELKIYLTESQTGRCEFVTNRGKDDIIAAIKASCALPSYYRKPVEVRGRVYYDGNVGKALPFEEALRDGCTDILVVATLRESDSDSPLLSRFLTFGFKKKVAKLARTRLLNYRDNLDMVFGKKKFRGVNIYTVAPNQTLFRGEIRRGKLEKAGMDGKSAILEAFRSIDAKTSN